MATGEHLSGNRWRVCVTREEEASGPLAVALREFGFEPVSCPVLVEDLSEDSSELGQVARTLDSFDWLVCASTRSVRALREARQAPWPRGLRTAAVGRRTAEALVAAGADPPPVVGEGDGADALWARLQGLAWNGVRVLVLTTHGGRQTLADGLSSAGALVKEVEAYRMHARDRDEVAGDWAIAAPDAVVVASPRAAVNLSAAVGPDTLRRLRAVVAIGKTTAAALAGLEVPCLVPPIADFREAARTLAELRDRGGRA